MGEALPGSLEHYLQVPAWVVYKSIPDDQMLWVNQRIAEDMAEPREWFVDRSDSEIWSGGDEAKQGRRAVDEGRVIDVVGDGHDLRGTWRWLHARLTPVDRQHLLIVCQDITARIQLAGLRLVLGGNFTGTSEGDFSQGFARQLLQGASLQEICDTLDLDGHAVRQALIDRRDREGFVHRRKIRTRNNARHSGTLRSNRVRHGQRPQLQVEAA